MSDELTPDELLDQVGAAVQARDTSLFDTGLGTHGLDALPAGPAAVDAIERALVDAGGRRALGRLLAADASGELDDLIPAADRLGINKARIARLSIMTRPAVYAVLGD